MAEPTNPPTLYVRVKDKSGKEFICPLDALKDPKDCTEEELKNCLDAADQAFSESEIFAIIKSEFRKDWATMPLLFRIFSDFVWPYCYIGKGIVEELKKEFPIDDEWLSYQLRPQTPPDGIPFLQLFPGVDMKERYAELNKAGEPFGIGFGERSFLSCSRPALEASEYARDKGRFAPFHERVFHAYFTDLLDIGDVEVLLDLAVAVGLDAEELKRILEDKMYAPRIEQAMAEAGRYGINAVPTFIVNEKHKIVGAQPLETFRIRLRRIQAE
jgi:predicted DsbA family dithiol-disulfide isomerase